MYLKKMTNKATGRTYLTIARGYRDPETGVTTSKSIKPLGYLDELERTYADPIAHFRQMAAEMTEADKSERQAFVIAANPNETLTPGADNRKNFGYIAILKVFCELDLHSFFLNRQRNRGLPYNTSAIMQFLVFSQLLSPAEASFDDRKRCFFERFDFSQRELYESFAYFTALAEEVQRHIHDRLTQSCRGNDKSVYYNVTNYYFEISEADKRGKGLSAKDSRSNPIVQMGLAADAEGLPIAYKLYAGNENDISTLRPALDEWKREYGVKRVIIVADKGINSSDNIHSLRAENSPDSYVVGFSARGGSKEFREYVRSATGYRRKNMPAARENDDSDFYSEFKIKSRKYLRSSDADGGAQRAAREKQVVFFSKQYAEKVKATRAEAVAKAKDLVANPNAYNRATSQDAAKYVKDLLFDKETGAILTDGEHVPLFDAGKLEADERYDGYHAVVTNETGRIDAWIVDTYRGLRRIEKFFACDRSARPAYVSREHFIGAHFLSRFIALAIVRVLQKKLARQYSVEEILENLRRIECCNEQENLYLFLHRSAVSDALGNALGIDFTKKRMRLSDIKRALGKAKRHSDPRDAP